VLDGLHKKSYTKQPPKTYCYNSPVKPTQTSQTKYNDIYASPEREVSTEESEYYKILGTLLKGKKTVDLGCGKGFVELYSPNTVAVDFSKEALAEARKRGIKNTVQADIQELPFENNEFEIALSNGVLEHAENIEKAIEEMVRVSEIQILIVHAKLPYGLELIKKPLMKLVGLKDQPIENPRSMGELKKILKTHGARTIIEGVWNYVDLRWLCKKLPYGLVKWPSHHFIVSIKTDNLDRQFLGDYKIGDLDTPPN
jgi:ubiquinone/menaquinone biosynthesis C-methylase UbiE